MRHVAALAVSLLLAPEGVLAQAHRHDGMHGHASTPTRADSLTPAQRETLSRQIAAARRATARYQDIDAARADGYVRFIGGEAPLVGEHWFRRDLVDAPLDLSRPSTLQYATIGGERRLIGVAYTVYQRPGEQPPEGFAGDRDQWHVHDLPELARMLTEGRPLLRRAVDKRIEPGTLGPGGERNQLVMVHAWLWLDNPDGMFAMRHRALPYLQAALPAEWAAAPDASEEAAWGLALLDARTCAREVRLADRVTRLSRRQSRALGEACAAAAARVREARAAAEPDAPDASTRLHASAAAAWRDYAAARDRTLTPP